jgi:hypothetical protein
VKVEEVSRHHCLSPLGRGIDRRGSVCEALSL